MAHDVVVVGAGLAGLTAARELTRSGFDAVVLEGRDRVGGRTNSAMLAGIPVDLGASFVGPTQDAVLKLAADLGCDTTPTFNDGANLIRWRGKVMRVLSANDENGWRQFTTIYTDAGTVTA